MGFFTFIFIAILYSCISICKLMLGFILPTNTNGSCVTLIKVKTSFFLLGISVLPFFLLNSTQTKTVWWLRVFNIFELVDKQCQISSNMYTISDCIVSQYMHRLGSCSVITFLFYASVYCLSFFHCCTTLQKYSFLCNTLSCVVLIFSGSQLSNNFYTNVFQYFQWVTLSIGLPGFSLILVDLVHQLDTLLLTSHNTDRKSFCYLKYTLIPICLYLCGHTTLSLIHLIYSSSENVVLRMLAILLLTQILACPLWIMYSNTPVGSLYSFTCISLYTTQSFFSILPLYHTTFFHTSPSVLVKFFFFFLWLICLAFIHSFYFFVESPDTEIVCDSTFKGSFHAPNITQKCLPYQTTHELIGDGCWFLSLILSVALFIPILLNWSNSPFFVELQNSKQQDMRRLAFYFLYLTSSVSSIFFYEWTLVAPVLYPHRFR